MKNAGPIVPTSRLRRRFSMAGDDCSLHFDLDALTPRQLRDHRENQALTGMLQVALCYLAGSSDEICIFDRFRLPEFAPAFADYHAMFTAMGLHPVPLERVSHHPVEGYYESVAAQATDCEAESLYMISGSNRPLHQSDEALARSRDLNSKMHFASHAPVFGLPVPATHLTSAAHLSEAEPFFHRFGPSVMLKTLGLAGARNVTTVDSMQAARSALVELPPDVEVLLQQRLEPGEWTEMTVDLHVSASDIHITNVRRILFADGVWVGNQLGPEVSVADAHVSTLLQAGEYARQHGFVGVDDAGWNLGIDYFVRAGTANGEPDLMITEINARWTGGLFPAELIRRLGAEDRSAIAFIDVCPVACFDDYRGFLARHLHGTHAEAFSMAPMGFSPNPANFGDGDVYYVWQVVLGDFDAFKAARSRELPDAVLPTVPRISTDL